MLSWKLQNISSFWESNGHDFKKKNWVPLTKGAVCQSWLNWSSGCREEEFYIIPANECIFAISVLSRDLHEQTRIHAIQRYFDPSRKCEILMFTDRQTTEDK